MIKLVTPPSALPVTVAEAKLASKALSALDDETVEFYLSVATAQLDGPYGLTKLPLVSQVWEQQASEPNRNFQLYPFGSIVEIIDVKSPSGDTLTDATLHSDLFGFEVRSSSRIGSVTVRVGFGDPADIPLNIKQAIVLSASRLAHQSADNPALRSFEVEGAFRETYGSGIDLDRYFDAAISSLLARWIRPTIA